MMISLKDIYSSIAVLVFNTLIGLLVVTGGAHLLIPEKLDIEGALNFSQFTGDTFEQAAKRFHKENYSPRLRVRADKLIAELIDYLKVGQWQMNGHYGLLVNRPFAGEFLTVDRDGFRRNHRVGETPSSHAELPASQGSTERPLKIALFGGSTMFGWGLPDHLTLPARLESLLKKEFKGREVECINLGVPYYNSGHEVVLLTHYLRNQKVRPDFVIFLDGLNDANHLLQLRSTTLLHRHVHKVYDWFQKQSNASIDLDWFSVNSSFPPFRLLVPEKKGGPVGRNSSMDRGLQKSPSSEVLVKQALDYSIKNWNVMRAVSAVYGVRSLIFLQPIALDLSHDQLWSSYFDIVHQLERTTGFHDLSGLFQRVRFNEGGDIVRRTKGGEEFPISFDGSHYTSKAIEFIAQEIRDAILASDKKFSSDGYSKLALDETLTEKTLTEAFQPRGIALGESELTGIRAGSSEVSGWRVHHSKHNDQFDEVLLVGDNLSQIYRSLTPLPTAKSFLFDLDVRSLSGSATVLVDLIFSKDELEISRATKSLSASDAESVIHFHFDADLPEGTNRVLFIVRPWREVDGLVQVLDGKISWFGEREDETDG